MTDTLEPRRFIVVGSGGTGGWLLEGLCRMVEYKMPGSIIIIVDGDTYEPKNAERQTFDDLGNKAEVTAKRLRGHFPQTFLVADTRWVVAETKEDPNDKEATAVAASALLNEGDVVFATVDNFAARKAIFDAAKDFENIDVFTGGNDDQLYGSVYHYVRRDGKDVTDHPAETHPELVDPPDRNPGELSCQERAELEGSVQTIAANMTVASFLLGRTKKTIIDGEEDTECEIMFDLNVGLAAGHDRRAEQEAPVEVSA